MSLELFALNGRRALITGAGQGIGYALAVGLSDAGGVWCTDTIEVVEAA